MMSKDYRNKKVKDLIESAVDFAIKDMDKQPNRLVKRSQKLIRRRKSRDNDQRGNNN
jgi:hypothetical protein